MVYEEYEEYEEVDETEFWDESDWEDYYDEMAQLEDESMIEMAAECTCGAWHIKDNKVIKVADCC